MLLSRQEVEDIAVLARLHLEPDEVTAMQRDLGAILELFAALAEVDTTGIAPMTHAVPMDLPLRADDVAPSLSVADALRGAPTTRDDLFVVPSIIPGHD